MKIVESEVDFQVPYCTAATRRIALCSLVCKILGLGLSSVKISAQSIPYLAPLPEREEQEEVETDMPSPYRLSWDTMIRNEIFPTFRLIVGF